MPLHVVSGHCRRGHPADTERPDLWPVNGVRALRVVQALQHGPGVQTTPQARIVQNASETGSR